MQCCSMNNMLGKQDVRELCFVVIVLLIFLLNCRYSGSPSVALLEASIQAKSGNAAAASETLAAVQPSHDGSGLEAVLMRAQLAASAGNVSQVSPPKTMPWQAVQVQQESVADFVL